MTTSLPHTHITRRDLSALTAGVPYVIGFPPTDSLVLFTFNRGSTLRMATTIRVDLPAAHHAAMVADHLVAAIMLNEAVAVIAVVVGGTMAEHRPLVDKLRQGFEANDILLVHASWVGRIAHGERWQCYLDPQCTDEVPDPQTSAMAAGLAIVGDPMYRSREEMAAQLAPDPAETLARREELLDEHLRNRQLPYTDDDLAADIALVIQAITDAEASQELPTLNDRQVVRLARALSNVEVKDECMAAALSATPTAAERLWTALIRALPVPERAEPAVLLAMSAYLRGSGVLAAVAIRTAIDAHPGHPTALLLEVALHKAIPPHHLRDLLMKSILRNEAQGTPQEEDDDPPWETCPPPGKEPATPPATFPDSPSTPQPTASPGTFAEPSLPDMAPEPRYGSQPVPHPLASTAPSVALNAHTAAMLGLPTTVPDLGPSGMPQRTAPVTSAESPSIPLYGDTAAQPSLGTAPGTETLPSGVLNARTAATLGLLTRDRTTTLDPLTAGLPPWPTERSGPG